MTARTKVVLSLLILPVCAVMHLLAQSNQTPAVRSAPPRDLSTLQPQTISPTVKSPQPTTPPKKADYPPNTQDRFNQAISMVTDPTNKNYPPIPSVPDGCSVSNVKVLKGQVQVDWPSGSSSAASFRRSGLYCFALTNVNNILFDYSFSLNTQEPTGDPFSLLKDAITTIKDFGTGSTTTQSKTAIPAPANPCTVSLDDVTQKAASLDQKLTAMQPPKDNSGKVSTVDLQATLSAWSPVQPAFLAFEQSVGTLITQMGTDFNRPGCSDTFAQAESIIIDKYDKARTNYLDLKSRADSRHVKFYWADIDNTNGYDLIADETFNNQSTTSGKKTYHFDPAYAILSSSAGFLFSEIQARTYSSRTAPNPSNPGTTQNVLGVDYGSGITPALLVLLNVNPPYINWKHLGFGVSAGPVFQIANGKADTSQIGLFGGVSLRLTPWLYLTPGVNVAQFADFPQGFTQAGQVIPPNTGTPTPTKRYTARFGFSVTFKLKDLFSKSSATSGTSNPSSNSGNSQPKPKQQSSGQT
jgi:hypothetical protein